MKKPVYCLMGSLVALLAFSVFGADRAPSAAVPQSAPKGFLERLQKGIAPFRSRDIQLENLDDPLIVKRPMVICHLLFEQTRRYTKEVRKPNPVVGLPDIVNKIPAEVREFADFVAIPKDSPFLLEKALKRTEENKEDVPPELKNFVFRKYGIVWKILKSPIKVYTLYLGEDKESYYFGQANLSVLLWFRKVFALSGGESSVELLGNALRVKDLESFTSRFAVSELAKYRNGALPALDRSIKESIELDEPPYAQFVCMKMIMTPESDRRLCQYAKSEDDVLLTGLFQAFGDNVGIRPSLNPVFFRMISSRRAPKLGVQCAMETGAGKEILPLMREYINQPYCFEDYALGVRTSFFIRTPDKRTPHEAAAEQIKLMLMRSGELPNTLNYTDINESELSKEERLAKQDSERIAPYVDMIVNSPDTDISILTALELALYVTKMPSFSIQSHVKGVKNSYLKRVHRTGALILKRLPREQVLRAFNGLLSFVENPEELKMLEDAYHVYSSSGK